MRTIRAIALAALFSLVLLLGAAPASAQTTTTMPGALPVTGAPDAGGEQAGAPPAALATTGIEVVPAVNVAIALIVVGSVLLVGLEMHRSGRRERSLWSY